MPGDTPADLCRRLKDVHEELVAINEDLPELLTLTPADDVGRTVALCQLLERQDSGKEYANL